MDIISKLPLALNPKREVFHKDLKHVTTLDYLQFRPIYSSEMIPNEKRTVNMQFFSRLHPLVKPAFAKATNEFRAFFVPYRTVQPNFNNMISAAANSDGTVSEGVGKFAPINWLRYVFNFTNDLCTVVVSASTSDALKNASYDFINPFVEYPTTSTPSNFDEIYNDLITDSYENPVGLVTLKPRGKILVNQLIALGYQLPFYHIDYVLEVGTPITGNRPFSIISQNGHYVVKFANYNGSSTIGAQNWVLAQKPVWQFALSSLPLMALLKVYSDWYVTPQMARSESGFTCESLITFFSERTSSFTGNSVYALAKFLTLLYYDDDYFTSASDTYFDQRGVNRTLSITDASLADSPGMTKSAVVSTTTNNASYTPRIFRGDQTSATVTSLTQYVLDSLGALSKWMRRNNIVGSRTLDRYLAHYGIKLEAEKLNRSVNLGKVDCDIKVMDVTAMSETGQDVNGQLGDYAGKGYAEGQGHWSYQADEFGQLIIISVIKPEVCYYQGIKRELFHFSRFDFFNPQFDNLGYQGIARGEVFATNGVRNSGVDPIAISTDVDAVVGYMPRYAEYKCNQQDILSGDFRIWSKGAQSYDYFHQFRTLGAGNLGADDWFIGAAFKGSYDASQYDRIFNSDSNNYDHFICDIFFNVDSTMPALPLWDSFELADEQHSQQSRNVTVGGTKY